MMKKIIFVLATVMLFFAAAMTVSAEEMYTISGSVNLPDAAEDYVWLDIIARKSGEYVMEYEDVSEYTGGVMIADGGNLGGYSITVPKGVYTISLYASGRAGKTLLGYFYYNAGVLSREYAMTSLVTVNSDTVIDLTLPAAENTISGKITFEEPLAEDCKIEVCAVTKFGSFYYNDFYSTATYFLDAGMTELEYSVAAASGDTALVVYKDNVGYMLSVNGGFDAAQTTQRWFDTAKLSYSNIDGTINFGRNVIPDAVEVTLNLPQIEENDTYYLAQTYDQNNYYLTTSAIYIDAGESTANGNIETPDTPFKLGIYDRKNGAVFFNTADGGVTTKISEAVVYNTDTTAVTVDYPQYMTVCGKVERGGIYENTCFSATAILVMNDDTSFYGSVRFDADGGLGEYKIYLPEYYNGMSARLATYIDECNGKAVTVIVGQDEILNIALPEEYTTNKFDIKVKLSESAPHGGVVVSISAGSISAKYYIPQGEDTLSINGEYPIDANGKISVYYYSDDYTFYGKQRRISVDATKENVIEIKRKEFVTISGTVTLPQYYGDGHGYEVYAADENNNVYGTYVSAMPGERSFTYHLSFPKGTAIEYIACVPLGSGEYYYYKGDMVYSVVTGDFSADITVPDRYEEIFNAVQSGDVKFSDVSVFLSGSDTIGVTYNYINDTDITQRFVLILCVYDNNKLVNVIYDEYMSMDDNASGTRSSYYTVEHNDNYTYKAFFVDSGTNMSPLINAATAE